MPTSGVETFILPLYSLCGHTVKVICASTFLVLINNFWRGSSAFNFWNHSSANPYDMQRIFINYRPHSYNWFFYLLDLPPYRLFLSYIFLKLNSRCMPSFLFWTLPLLFFLNRNCCVAPEFSSSSMYFSRTYLLGIY